MLVRVWKSIVLKGYTTVEKGFFKKRMVREDIYLSCGISGLICDETEVEEKLAEALQQKMKETEGWGINFEGWTELCTDRKILQKRYPYKDDYWFDCVTSGKPQIEYVSDYSMEKVLKVLNGQQFAQFCKENNLTEIKLK